MIRKHQRVLFVLLAILLYMYGIAQRPLFAPDEVRYAEIPREMIATGDWIVPHLAGVPYFEKPVLGYWLTAGSMLAFGETPFAVRFPAAISVLLVALLLWKLGKSSEDERLGETAALIWLTSVLPFAIGTFAVLDGPFAFFVMLAWTGGCFAVESKGRTRLGWLAAAGVGLGCGFLIKGLLAPVLIGLAAVPALVWRRDWKNLLRLPWIPLAVALLIALPWSIAVHRAAPEFWYRFLWVEHVQRLISGQGAADNRAQPFFYYIPVLLVGSMPWCFTLLASIPACRAKRRALWRKSFLVQLALWSAGLWFLFFSLSSGKLITYLLPVMAPVALLLGRGLLECGERELAIFNRILKAGSVMILAAAAVAAVWQLLPGKFIKLYPGFRWLAVPFFSLILWAWWWYLAARAEERSVKIRFCALGIACVLFFVHPFMPPLIIRSAAPGPFLTGAVRPLCKADGSTIVCADGSMAAAAAWFLRSPVQICFKAGELSCGAQLDGKRILTVPDVEKLGIERGGVLYLTRSKNRLREFKRPGIRLSGVRWHAIWYPPINKDNNR